MIDRNHSPSPHATDPHALADILQDGFFNLQASLETIQTAFQTGFNSLTSEIRRSSADSFNQIIEYLDSMQLTQPVSTQTPTTIPTLSPLTPTTGISLSLSPAYNVLEEILTIYPKKLEFK